MDICLYLIGTQILTHLYAHDAYEMNEPRETRAIRQNGGSCMVEPGLLYGLTNKPPVANIPRQYQPTF